MGSPGIVRSRPLWTRGLLVLAVALVAAYVVWTLPGVRPQPGFDRWYDGLLQGSAYALVAVLAVAGAWQRRPVRLAWQLVVVAVVLRSVGFDLTLTTLALGDRPSYPSLADAAWVLSSLALGAALVLRLRELSVRLGRLVALDGVAVSLFALGLTINVIATPLVTLTGPGLPPGAVATNLAYLLMDAGLVVLVAASATIGRGRLSVADLVLLVGVSSFVVVDVVYFVLLANGDWRPGTLLASLSLVATACIAAAVMASRASVRPPPRRTGDLPVADLQTGIAVPAGVVAGLLVVTELSGFVIPAVAAALVCYAASGAIAIGRGLRTVSGLQAEARRAVGEASEDLHLFKSLVDASRELIGMADEQGHLLYLNPSGRALLGVADDLDVTTLSVGDVAPGNAEVRYADRWAMLREVGIWRGETELVPVDGSPAVPVEVSTFLVSEGGVRGRPVFATIQRDIRARRRNEQALRDLSDQRARLLQRLVQAEEDERARIAHDVHDDPVQALAAVDLRLGLLQRRLLADELAYASDAAEIKDIVAHAMERLRTLLFDLEALPEGLALSAAVEDAAAFIFAGVPVRVDVVGERDLPVSEPERVSIHRVVKEALTNARKHADPEQVRVELAVRDGSAVVTVDDDGRGIAPGDERARPGHLGLSAMRDRAQVMGADLEVRPREEGGTRVRLVLPLPASVRAGGGPGT